MEIVKEVAKLLPILFACMGGNILSGTLASMTIDKFKFNPIRFFDGIVRAAVAGVCLLILAYASQKIDLSSIGYSATTIVSTGIVLYAAKMAKNLIKLVGLSEQMNGAANTVASAMKPKGQLEPINEESLG
nr:MAG TPA: hypothetical protein [Caudoviricetes sp.]